MFKSSTVQKTKKYRRYFEVGTNTSIAANTKETLFSKTEKMVFRELYIKYDGDDTTGTALSELKVTADGVVVLNISLANLYADFGYAPGIFGKNSVICTTYSATSKAYGFYLSFDTNIVSSLLIEFTNADATNAATMNSGILYDIEI